MAMTISFARHQFPPVIIRHAVWLYVRLTLSYRDVEDLLAERGLDVSHETVRRWDLKFEPLFARGCCQTRCSRRFSSWKFYAMSSPFRYFNSARGHLSGSPALLWYHRRMRTIDLWVVQILQIISMHQYHVMKL
jgi:hypothetical protein